MINDSNNTMKVIVFKAVTATAIIIILVEAKHIIKKQPAEIDRLSYFLLGERLELSTLRSTI